MSSAGVSIVICSVMIMQWGGTHDPEQQDCSEIDDTLEQVILILHKRI